MRTLLTLLVAIGLITSVPPRRQVVTQTADPQFEALATLVTQKMAEYGVPGVAFGILRDGRAMLRGFGTTNIDNPQPLTPQTVFPIASISKTVTATAIMRLVEQGKLDLEAPVRKYIPEFAVEDPAASGDVAIWHLLTHTPGWEGQISGQDRGTESLAHFVERMQRSPQLAPPGRVWSYNNAGFTVAGRVIEVASRQGIHEAIRSLVFEPIGLTRAFTRTEEAVTYRFAAAHRTRNDELSVVRPVSRSSTVTAGGVWMSVEDLLEYAAFHMGDGRGADGKPVLSRATLERMRTARVPKVGTDDAMGLGWHLRRVGGVLTASHGGTLGHISLLTLVPERNMALAILTNHANGWRLIQDVERASLERLDGLTLDPAHAIGHRGVNETMPDAPILETQPDPAPYLGVYRRPPLNATNTVQVENGQLTLDGSPIAFYGPDRAVVLSGGAKGNPVEFIRDDTGSVRWARYIGRIALKEK
ncbi:MAG TPA: serine hydrolase domain-containing protein [Vicinamibacterales bacterium]